MSFPSIWPLSSEEQHIKVKCQLSVPLQTGSSLMIIIGKFYVSVYTNETVWVEARQSSPMMHFRMLRSFNRFPKCKFLRSLSQSGLSWLIGSSQEFSIRPFPVNIFGIWRKSVEMPVFRKCQMSGAVLNGDDGEAQVSCPLLLAVKTDYLTVRFKWISYDLRFLWRPSYWLHHTVPRTRREGPK